MKYRILYIIYSHKYTYIYKYNNIRILIEYMDQQKSWSAMEM